MSELKTSEPSSLVRPSCLTGTCSPGPLSTSYVSLLSLFVLGEQSPVEIGTHYPTVAQEINREQKARFTIYWAYHLIFTTLKVKCVFLLYRWGLGLRISGTLKLHSFKPQSQVSLTRKHVHPTNLQTPTLHRSCGYVRPGTSMGGCKRWRGLAGCVPSPVIDF